MTKLKLQRLWLGDSSRKAFLTEQGRQTLSPSMVSVMEGRPPPAADPDPWAPVAEARSTSSRAPILQSTSTDLLLGLQSSSLWVTQWSQESPSAGLIHLPAEKTAELSALLLRMSTDCRRGRAPAAAEAAPPAAAPNPAAPAGSADKAAR